MHIIVKLSKKKKKKRHKEKEKAREQRTNYSQKNDYQDKK